MGRLVGMGKRPSSTAKADETLSQNEAVENTAEVMKNAVSSARTLEQMREEHLAIARYRVYLFEPRKARGQQKTYLKPYGLRWDEACARRDELNAALKAEGKDGFTDPSYGLDLENGWDCLPQAARDRHLLLGKGPKDFTLTTS